MPEKEQKPDYSSHPNMRWYRSLRVFFWVLFHTFWPMRIRGREHLPPEGSGKAALIVCNHLSLIDPFAVAFAAGQLVSFMAKEELFRIPVLGFVIRKMGAFPVDRSRQDAASLRTALTVLKEGRLLGMFPEGTRSATGHMQEFRTGAARLAARTRTPIIPCALINTDKALPPKKWIRPARIAVVFGEAFELTELYDRNDKGEAMERAIETIQERIRILQEPSS